MEVERTECDDGFKKTARAFRTTIPKVPDDPSTRPRQVPEVHVVSLTYPLNSLSVSKMKYLRRYRSFIHEARIICHDAESSVKDIYDSLIPKGCVVQFFHVEYSVDTDSATVNMKSLVPLVSSIHIKIPSIREDDVFRAVSTVCESEDFGIRISGWHEFDAKYVEFVLECCSKKKNAKMGKNEVAKATFAYEVAKTYIVFWSEESYQSVENSTLGMYTPEDSSRPSNTSRDAVIPSDST